MSVTKKTPRPLNESIWGLFRALGVETKVKRYHVLELWPDIVGERLAEVTKAESVKEGTLIVKTKNSVWRTELSYLKADILDRIEAEVGSAVIEDIRFL